MALLATYICRPCFQAAVEEAHWGGGTCSSCGIATDGQQLQFLVLERSSPSVQLCFTCADIAAAFFGAPSTPTPPPGDAVFRARIEELRALLKRWSEMPLSDAKASVVHALDAAVDAAERVRARTGALLPGDEVRDAMRLMTSVRTLASEFAMAQRMFDGMKN